MQARALLWDSVAHTVPRHLQYAWVLQGPTHCQGPLGTLGQDLPS
jgi:hypothetical protein